MSNYLKYYNCYLKINDLIDSEIIEIITRILKEKPSEKVEGRFVKLETIENSCNVQYRIKLTDEEIEKLKKRVDFAKKFVREYRHFHITLYKEINKNGDLSIECEDEGTARERKDGSWDLYYDEGSLQNYLEINDEIIILNVPNSDIKSLDDIENRFKSWVDEQKRKIAEKYFINFPPTKLIK
ncbi:hypothetical protein JCM14036_16900 [Desulfotomaculum defluvii]